MDLTFRLLRADEIDARVSTVKENGVSVLLYKDARCDMNILDETVGVLNWQRSHSRDNANCTVSIWDEKKSMWISKEDTGTESNTEKEKGLASDSFKRACFNFGIGRELYTAPFIWFTADECKIVKVGQKVTCYDRFKVDEIQYSGRRISYLKIVNMSTKKAKEFCTREGMDANIGENKASVLKTLLTAAGVDIPKLLKQRGVSDLTELTEAQYTAIVEAIKRKNES